MFLAAGPYFQSRFRADERILALFQPAELTVSTVANLGSMVVLANLQARASYPKRIIVALLINVVVFTLMAMSTRLFLGVSPQGYFIFLVMEIFVSSLATGLMQNGIFAYMSGFGRKEYAQGNMTGQAIAGVLPCIVQIASVLSAPVANESTTTQQESSTAALAYFLTATAISFLTLVAFLCLLAHNTLRTSDRLNNGQPKDTGPTARKRIPLLTLFRKTFWLSISVFLTFAITMTFPVFTQQIQSVQPPDKSSRIFQPATFIPLAFLVWNSGDLIGRLLAAIPAFRIADKPRLIFTLAVSRVVFIPLYLLCNIRGQGARVNSDLFYLLVVQLLFGISNGFVGTTCMTGAIEYVDVDEREATGGFMALSLVGGLAVGSLLSFAVA
jgi:equilibrative nucleoside transporter 1/2/3